MKKGCFIKAIFFLIILIGIAYYMYEEYGRDLIAESKEELVKLAYDNLMDNISVIPASEYLDSLKILFEKKLDEIKIDELDLSNEEVDELLTNVNEFIRDKKIELEEYSLIKKILSKDERSKKNRD